MRAINADALEKTLRDWIRDHWTEAFTGDDAGAEFADMIEHAETIDAVPSAQPEPKWIPCSEGLPEERGFYLTTTKDKAVYCDYWNEDNFDRTEMVIAWMPLPEAYRGGDEQE